MKRGRTMLLPDSKRAKRRMWETLGEGDEIISEAITKYAEEKKFIRISKYGFTKGKSCLSNLIAFCDGMTDWVSEGRPASASTSARFLTFSHDILIGKLRKLG